MSWETSRPVPLSIQGPGPVASPSGEYQFTMPTDGHFLESFTFEAELTFGTQAFQAEIYPASVIREFKVLPALPQPGEEITFHWQTSGANYPITLSDNTGFSTEITTSQFTHVPQNAQLGEQRIYTLSITNERGTISTQIPVTFSGERINFITWKQNYDLVGENEDRGDLSDFLEYATGSDPSQSSDPPLTVTRDEAGHLNLKYPENLAAENANLLLESSTDLQSWSLIRTGYRLVESTQAPNSTVSTNHYQSLLPMPLENRYFRLRAVFEE